MARTGVPQGSMEAGASADRRRRFRGTTRHPEGLLVGLDVGSTTVKAAVVDPAADRIVWQDYRRHETRQPETCVDFLERIEKAFPDAPREAFRIFATGSGGAAVGRHLGAAFVQEAIAVSLAVEALYPDVESVIELGGQDAKIIVFRTDEASGRRKKIPSMNDKCAGGTGAVIDKINAKLKIPPERLGDMGYDGIKVHPVAGKCGVFAETDITGLQKQGVPPEELMASLFEAIVQQNLSVLTRGHTLRPRVLLLGGPNRFIRGLRECWRKHIPAMWAERNVPVPEDRPIEELIEAPDNGHYFAALGAIHFARLELADNPDLGVYRGADELRRYIEDGRGAVQRSRGRRGLVRDAEDLQDFLDQYRQVPWEPPQVEPGRTVEAYVGIDGGSTSTKAVLVSPHREVLAKAYRLSRGNPIEDTVELLGELRSSIEDRGGRLVVRGVGTTGYAKDILKDVLGADVALVETVAHTQSGLHYYPHADVICDVGGQDIKIIVLKNGAVKDFKLNTQCSAGNGYFLQATAAEFGYDVEDYADTAFSAETMPEFGYGCAVFMQSDIVDFQRQGWRPHEILAGLAAVLPKNIWLYVCQMPNLATLGRTFVLQGGTQRNLAAVKAQVDFIRDRYAGTGIEPEIVVHRHCGESGAIGCAFEAMRVVEESGRPTSFIGLDAAASLRYRTTRGEETRCSFCKNRCLRTFIDVTTGTGSEARERRVIIATCEKGAVEAVDDMREIKKALDAAKKAHPNFAEIAAREAFRPVGVPLVADPLPTPLWFMTPRRRRATSERRTRMEGRDLVRIGMPRVLNLYGLAPFFLGYFQSLGIPGDRIVWSDYTTEALFREGSRRGSIDPCFPSKLAIAHVHDLLFRKHTAGRPLTHIFFPIIDSMPSPLVNTHDSRSCPTAAATPEAVHAAFVKESDVFAERGVRFKKTFVNLEWPALCGRQMHRDWAEDLGLSEAESVRAAREGLRALAEYGASLRRRAREVLDGLERERRLGIVLLARPYHQDPGVSHGIAEEFQKRGYPVFTVDSLPRDADLLDRLFGAEVEAGAVSSPMGIEDVWKNSFSENTSRKLWAAKYVARHPNLVALELSSFKCGHDAPVYSVVEEIIERSGTPHFSFKDIDENKPRGAIKIRVETIAYFLARYREEFAAAEARRPDLDAGIEAEEKDRTAVA